MTVRRGDLSSIHDLLDGFDLLETGVPLREHAQVATAQDRLLACPADPIVQSTITATSVSRTLEFSLSMKTMPGARTLVHLFARGEMRHIPALWQWKGQNLREEPEGM
jgi:hypothetical protein